MTGSELPALATPVSPATTDVAKKRQKERMANMERMFKDIIDDVAGCWVVFVRTSKVVLPTCTAMAACDMYVERTVWK